MGHTGQPVRHCISHLLSGALLVLSTGVPCLARAQIQPAAMHGRVVDRASAAPIRGAEIVLVSDGRRRATDSVGHYAFSNLPVGTVHFVVRAADHSPRQLDIDFAGGDDLLRTIELDSAAVSDSVHSLPAVSVSADAPRVTSYRLLDFERRRRTGRGQYLSDEEIKASGAANVSDATRGMRGVTLHCGGSAIRGCRIQMARAPMNCEPEYIVDGRADNMFGPVTPIRDIVALEVYTGPSDVPGEFAGTNAGCGVIVMWTRSGPPARKR
jgi:hypothetical protein